MKGKNSVISLSVNDFLREEKQEGKIQNAEKEMLGYTRYPVLV